MTDHLIMPAARILINIASAFFLASGCWGDLFIIRFFLTCAYATIIAFYFSIGANIENYVWCFACLYLHGSSAVRILLDEGPVVLDEEKEQEALWRFFYRRSGISRLLFKCYVATCFELIDAKEGTHLDTNQYFYIILDGAVDMKSTVAGQTKENTLVSGQSFDIKHLRPLAMGRSAYNKQHQRMTPFINQEISATVSIDSKIFRCSSEQMRDLYSHRAAKDASQGLLIATLSDIAERQYMTNPPIPNDSMRFDMVDEENGQLLESVRSTYISERSAIFAPLEDFEEPPSYLAGSGSFVGLRKHILHTFKVMFLAPWPFMPWLPGLRQIGSLPVPKATSGG
ncbi:hypothetical protein ACHAXR_004318 [Thalassiosira sp. AJA248-18]